MCPGVGKTYAMLEAARELRNRGMDVVTGLVETHGRPETEALAEVLPRIPPAAIPYRGTTLRELDLDAILLRKPELVLVDELAHTNAPGSRHPKRYQDVEELLEAGIDVYTTINVQHVAGRADLVTQITGAPVREIVPDSFLELAEQIELVDISPPELLKRLGEGKVYLGDRAERAAANFFREEHLTALRELALRFTAEKVDDQLRNQLAAKRPDRPWHTTERLLVAVSSSPYSARLVRATRRKAYALNAPWYALYVNTGREEEGAARERLLHNLSLAAELGAEVIQTQDRNVAEALRRVAEEKNVTQIVLGRPDRRFLRDFFAGGTILDQLVRETSEIDIHVVRQERKPQYTGFHLNSPSFKSGLGAYVWTFAVLLLTAWLCHLALPWLGYRAVGLIFLCVVMALGTFSTGLGPSMAGAFLSVLLWDFFFIPPLFTLTIEQPEDLMTCFTFLPAVGLTGLLTRRIRRQERDILARERQANFLYAFSRRLAEAGSPDEIAACGYEGLENYFKFTAAIVPRESNDRLAAIPLASPRLNLEAKDMAVAAWCFKNHRRAGQGTETLASAGCLCLPLPGHEGLLGVLLLFFPREHRLDQEQELLLETLASLIGAALERADLAARNQEAEILRRSERLHQTLLHSVSHELRTPLTSLMGAASALSKAELSGNAEHQAILAETIEEGAERLNRVVENLLNMSRVAGGALVIKDEVFELGEFTKTTLERGRRLLPDRPVAFQPPKDEILARGDWGLMEQVLLNIFANVSAHTPAGSPMEIRLLSDSDTVRLEVADHGPGLPEEASERIFERFYRLPGSPAGGTGLGLSIAKSLMEAQKGSISAHNRDDGSGCVFTLTLRRAFPPPDLLVSGEAE
jgi:two-component system sensor histidine kinase KdpD